MKQYKKRRHIEDWIIEENGDRADLSYHIVFSKELEAHTHLTKLNLGIEQGPKEDSTSYEQVKSFNEIKRFLFIKEVVPEIVDELGCCHTGCFDCPYKKTT